MLFLEATSGRRLAIHIEFKSPREALGLGQAAAYPLRAAHFANRAFCPPNMVPHDDWLTLLLRADDELGKPAFAAFCRVIGHGEAARMVPGYIDPQRQRNV